MKKIMTLVVVFLFAFAMTTVAFAAEKAAPAATAAPAAEKKEAAKPAAEKKAPAKVQQVTGDVTAVDAKAGTITVKGKNGEVTVAVDAKTAVKVGDKVTAKYTEVDGKNVAKSVKAKVAAAPAKAEEKKAEPKKAEPAKPAEPKK